MKETILSDPQYMSHFLAILGVGIGILGAITGAIGGVFVRQGKCRGLLATLWAGIITIGLTMFAVGGYAFFVGRPFQIWGIPLFGGLALTIFLTPGFIFYIKCLSSSSTEA